MPWPASASVRRGLRALRLDSTVGGHVPGQYSGGHDARKASTRRQHSRLAYVVRVENFASVAYAAASARSAWIV
jgi:hypothetical protein